jgi:hypothetical protein
VLGALATVAIFFMHLLGLLFLAVLLGGEELAVLWRLRRTTGAGWPHLRCRMVMGAIAFAPPFVLNLMAPLDHLDNGVIYHPIWRKTLQSDGAVSGL